MIRASNRFLGKRWKKYVSNQAMPEVLVCTSHECQRGSHHECKGILSVDPATGELNPPAEIAEPRFAFARVMKLS
jgi:hypothetical protein